MDQCSTLDISEQYDDSIKNWSLQCLNGVCLQGNSEIISDDSVFLVTLINNASSFPAPHRLSLEAGVHVRDHSLGEVIRHESRKESSKERLKEPYKVDALLPQPFYLHSLTEWCQLELSPFQRLEKRRNHLHVSIEAPPHPSGQCPSQVNWWRLCGCLWWKFILVAFPHRGMHYGFAVGCLSVNIIVVPGSRCS